MFTPKFQNLFNAIVVVIRIILYFDVNLPEYGVNDRITCGSNTSLYFVRQMSIRWPYE